MFITDVHGIAALRDLTAFDFDISVRFDEQREERMWFTLANGDEAEISQQLRLWWGFNPNFPVAPYVEPEPEAIDPLTQNLTKRQVVRAMIIGASITDPDGFVEAAIATMTDATAKALALTDWRYAPYFERGHALFSDPEILVSTGMTPAMIDGLWSVGYGQPK